MLSCLVVDSLASYLDLFIHFLFPLQKNTERIIMIPQNAETAILSASYMDYVRNKGRF